MTITPITICNMCDHICVNTKKNEYFCSFTGTKLNRVTDYNGVEFHLTPDDCPVSK